MEDQVGALMKIAAVEVEMNPDLYPADAVAVVRKVQSTKTKFPKRAE
jgi:hypothetical protein